jgi:hypothetical protein
MISVLWRLPWCGEERSREQRSDTRLRQPLAAVALFAVAVISAAATASAAGFFI